jgi:hypothetical protein
MADASGTPTSPDNIPTYNTGVDPPSGKGFNTAMAQIQAIFTNLKAGTLASGKIAMAALNATGTPANTNFLRGDGTWTVAPTITTSTLAGGPPGSPKDGDIWIATGVDTNGTRWQFQYDAAWVTDANKWKFIGGIPFTVSDSVSFTTSNGGTYVSFPTPMSYTVVRSGVYDLISGGFAFSTTGLSSMGLGLHVNGVNQANLTAGSNIPSGSAGTLNAIPCAVAATAGQAIDLRYFSNVANTGAARSVEYLPRRII